MNAILLDNLFSCLCYLSVSSLYRPNDQSIYSCALRCSVTPINPITTSFDKVSNVK